VLEYILPIWRRNGSHMKALNDLSFLIRESEAAYQANAAAHLTSDELADFRRDPYLYHKKKCGLVIDDDQSAFIADQAASAFILDGRERFEQEYAVGGSMNPKTGEPLGCSKRSSAPARPVITGADAALTETLAESVRSHALADELLSSGVAKGVIRTSYRDMASQARLGWLNPERGLVDLKICDHLIWFEVESRGFGYVHQMAFHRALIFQATGVIVPVTLIAVEKREPHRTGVFALCAAVLNKAQRENERAMQRLALCRAADDWPTGYEELRTINYL